MMKRRTMRTETRMMQTRSRGRSGPTTRMESKRGRQAGARFGTPAGRHHDKPSSTSRPFVRFSLSDVSD